MMRRTKRNGEKSNQKGTVLCMFSQQPRNLQPGVETMNATHTHDLLGQVELRGTRKVGRGAKGRTVALVFGNNGNQQVELDTLTPIRRTVKAPVAEARSLGYTNKGTMGRGGMRIERLDRARLGVKGDSGARSCVEYARNIAPESLRDLEPKAAPILKLTSQDNDGLGIKARISGLVLDALRTGKVTVEQARKLCNDNGIRFVC